MDITITDLPRKVNAVKREDMAKIYIGTSGWYYDHWENTFYPEDTAPLERLPYYATQFGTVEINNTFYHLPLEKSVENWYQKVPKNFIFSVKASRYITHLKRLRDPVESTKYFFERLKPLKEKMGPILFQLPPSFKKELERLEEFLSCLEKGLHTFEFRHSSWYSDDTYDLLKRYSAALCITDLKGKLSPEEVTSKFVYIRLHGPQAPAYTGSYGPEKLKAWKKRIEKWSDQKLAVYCYFDNDEKSFATQDARELLRQLNLA
jgi:uncharacterized protein YecE (DUF72 family)